MSQPILTRVTAELLALGDKNVSFVWHGGEPLTLGRSFFLAAIRAQNRFSQQGQIVENDLQTNGILINDNWVKFFKDYNFKLGISIDGPKWLNDKHRRSIEGQGSFESIMRSIELMQKNELKFGVLSVLTKDGLGCARDLYYFFKAHGLRRFDFLPNIEGRHDHNPCPISPDDYADFMISLFDVWIEDNDPDVHIRYLDNVLTSFLGGRSYLCSSGSTCSNFITVDVDGGVYACDTLVPDAQFRFGNVMEENLSEILRSVKRLRFVEQVRSMTPECIVCNYKPVCKGDCTYNRYIPNGNLADHSIMCNARKRIFQHIESYLRRLLQTKRENAS